MKNINGTGGMVRAASSKFDTLTRDDSASLHHLNLSEACNASAHISGA
jgi:hypothetical protein